MKRNWELGTLYPPPQIPFKGAYSTKTSKFYPGADVAPPAVEDAAEVRPNYNQSPGVTLHGV